MLVNSTSKEKMEGRRRKDGRRRERGVGGRERKRYSHLACRTRQGNPWKWSGRTSSPDSKQEKIR